MASPALLEYEPEEICTIKSIKSMVRIIETGTRISPKMTITALYKIDT